ncbi:hypothetical protein, partial [Gallibacterium anatis]|uniref:hypothetical protein n=1 Tax=Gallibacterium anatis TaxID=750 RepID=UPI001E2F01AB
SVQGALSFPPFSLGKQRQPYRLNVALATARSARRSRSKMGSPFGRNQSINARHSRKKMKSIFRSKPTPKTTLQNHPQIAIINTNYH